MREQLSALATALDVSQTKVKDQQGQIADLGQKLNLALANKVEELARYRSEFFGRLREILGDRPDIRVVGDRFVFQSEVLFAPGSADLTDAAKAAARPGFRHAEADRRRDPARPQLGPAGQTATPTSGRSPQRSFHRIGNCRRRARSRWCAMRSNRASPPTGSRLLVSPTTDPIDPGDTPEAYARNRRIELKLTER